MLINANSHIERGGRPVKNSTVRERTPLMITCQPMATYFSRDCFRSRFQRAWRTADVSNSAMARMGMADFNLPRREYYGE